MLSPIALVILPLRKIEIAEGEILSILSLILKTYMPIKNSYTKLISVCSEKEAFSKNIKFLELF